MAAAEVDAKSGAGDTVQVRPLEQVQIVNVISVVLVLSSLCHALGYDRKR